MTRRILLMSALLLLSASASLAAQATPRAPDILGKWEFTVESPQGANVMTITFARVDGALTGSGESQMGAFPIVEVAQAGADLTFSLRFEQNGQTMDIPFKGKVNGATAEGSLTFAMNGQSQAIPWKAKRLPPG